MKTHYRVDMSVVRRETRRDPDLEEREARRNGYYTYEIYKLVPLRDIEPEAVWNRSRIERIREALHRNKPLPPISLSKSSSGRYVISDGIHRYNASKEAGFTHIPALLTVFVEVPEKKEPELPERPKMRVRDVVLVREPRKYGLDSPWAVIEEVLHSSRHRGIKRHHYALVGIRKGRADFIGDFRDDELDIPSRKPPKKFWDLIADYELWPSSSRVTRSWLRSGLSCVK